MINPKTVTYAFHPTQRTIDFAGTPGFDVRNLRGIIHPGTGSLIYFPGDPTTGLDLMRSSGTLVALLFNTASLGASDPLLVLYEDGTAPLPANASTADRQDAAAALLTAIRDAVLAQRSETIWTDDSGARYVRVVRNGSITWTDLAGNTSAAPGAGARPDSDSGTVVSHATYQAIASGTGYSNGDILDHVVVTDGDAGDLVANFWLNVVTGAKIAAPAAGNISVVQPPTATALTQILNGIGTTADQDPGSDTAASSLIGLTRRLFTYLGGLLKVYTPPLETKSPVSAVNDAVAVSCVGRSAIVVQVPTGTWTGTLVLEGSALGDFTDAVTLNARTIGAGAAAPSATITTGGTYEANASGLSAVRVRASVAVTGGPLAVLVRAAVGLRSLRVHAPASEPLPVTGTLTTSGSVTTTDVPSITINAGQDTTPVAANPTRSFLEITNTGPNPMALRFGAAASALNGRIIGPGQTATYTGAVPNGAVHLFSTAGTTAFITTA